MPLSDIHPIHSLPRQVLNVGMAHNELRGLFGGCEAVLTLILVTASLPVRARQARSEGMPTGMAVELGRVRCARFRCADVRAFIQVTATYINNQLCMGAGDTIGEETARSGMQRGTMQSSNRIGRQCARETRGDELGGA